MLNILEMLKFPESQYFFRLENIFKNSMISFRKAFHLSKIQSQQYSVTAIDNFISFGIMLLLYLYRYNPNRYINNNSSANVITV